MTILISSHILSDLSEMCSYIGIMELGRLVESSRLQELYDRVSQEELLIATIDGLEQLTQLLARSPQIESWTPLADRTGVTVIFSGSTEDSVTLLRAIVQANIPISEFHRTQENLEDIFLKLGHKQVS